jgi:hypothetical protein
MKHALVATAPLHDQIWTKGPSGGQCIAAEPGGQLAVTAPGGLAVFDASDVRQTALVASAPLPGAWSSVHYCAPDRLITLTYPDGSSPCQVQLWQFDGTRLVLLAARSLDGWPRSPVVIPGLGLIAVSTTVPGELWFLDSGTLVDATPPDGWPTRVYGLYNSADLDRCVLAGDEFVEVYDSVHPAAYIADRAPGQRTPRDLALISARMRGIVAGSPRWPLLDLLRTWLEHRFGTDVGVGSAARTSAHTSARNDDVAL